MYVCCPSSSINQCLGGEKGGHATRTGARVFLSRPRVQELKDEVLEKKKNINK